MRKQVVQAEEGPGFQEYVRLVRGKYVPVKAGQRIGIEVLNATTGEWELRLDKNIRFQN